MRKIIISKQVTKKGKKQRRKIEKALATIKVGDLCNLMVGSLVALLVRYAIQ